MDAQTAAEPGAPDGRSFEFLFIRQPKAEGLFTLLELRDVTIDGRATKRRPRSS
jgi:hypothetical protein